MEIRKILKYGVTAVGTVLLLLWLGVVTVENRNIPVNELAGQWAWFYKWGIALSAYGIIMYACYPETWQRLWVETVSWILISLGIYESIIGLMQVYGYSMSNHSLYALTGTFYNPGPYSGYLAMITPIALHEYIRLGKIASKTILIKAARYYALFAFLLCLCVLPSGMSRSAWLATAGGILFVVFNHFNGKKRIINFFHANRQRAIIIASIILCSLLILASGAFYLKKDSANGRLFMWKITCHAITERPVIGSWGSFPKIYGEAQEKYFAEGDYTDEEARVAGSPEYAFNEYLQIAAEKGILYLFVGICLIILCLYFGVRNHKYGICGAVLSLSIFAFSSYPLQFPAFWSAGIAMLMACIPDNLYKHKYLIRITGIYICLAGIVLAPGLYLQWNKRSAALEKWNNAKLLYNTRAYEAAQPAYEELYKEMKWNFRYLFEYGHILSKRKEYNKSISILLEAETKSNDPMILNVIGKDFQEMKLYDKAEEYFKRSVNRLPSRIYPYYLLTKLYAETEYCYPEKLKEYAKIVITKTPKIPSPAVEDMKKEIGQLLKTRKITLE